MRSSIPTAALTSTATPTRATSPGAFATTTRSRTATFRRCFLRQPYAFFFRPRKHPFMVLIANALPLLFSFSQAHALAILIALLLCHQIAAKDSVLVFRLSL